MLRTLLPTLSHIFFEVCGQKWFLSSWADPLKKGKAVLDPLQWPHTCFDPHVLNPVFCVDSKNVCFQDLNRPSSWSKLVFVHFSRGRRPKFRENAVLGTLPGHMDWF